MAIIQKNLLDLADFTRATPATGWVNGRLHEFGINEPRLVTDPATGYSGLLLEPVAKANLIDHSKLVIGEGGYFDRVVSNVLGPDGKTYATKCILADGVEASAGGHVIVVDKPEIETKYTYFAILKAGEYTSARVYISGATTDRFAHVTVDLNTGEVESATGNIPDRKYGVISLGDGWYQIYITATSDASNRIRPRIYAAPTTLVGDGISGIYLWAVDLQEGELSSHIPTDGSQVTRAGDRFILPTDRFDYRPDRGTLLVDAMVMAKAYAGYLVTISETLTHTGGYQINMGWPDERNNTVLRTYITNGGDTTSTAELTPRLLAGNRVKLATSWDSSGFVTAARGEVTTQVVQPDGYPDVKNLILSAGAFSIVRRVLYYPERLPDAQLAALTEI